MRSMVWLNYENQRPVGTMWISENWSTNLETSSLRIAMRRDRHFELGGDGFLRGKEGLICQGICNLRCFSFVVWLEANLIAALTGSMLAIGGRMLLTGPGWTRKLRCAASSQIRERVLGIPLVSWTTPRLHTPTHLTRCIKTRKNWNKRATRVWASKRTLVRWNKRETKPSRFHSIYSHRLHHGSAFAFPTRPHPQAKQTVWNENSETHVSRNEIKENERERRVSNPFISSTTTHLPTRISHFTQADQNQGWSVK